MQSASSCDPVYMLTWVTRLFACKLGTGTKIFMRAMLGEGADNQFMKNM